MRLRRRPSSVDLERWLESGEPARVERWLDDPAVTSRLEELTRLRDGEIDALTRAVAPASGFEHRTAAGVQERVGDVERVGVLLGLLGLGPRTMRSVIDDQEER